MPSLLTADKLVWIVVLSNICTTVISYQDVHFDSGGDVNPLDMGSFSQQRRKNLLNKKVNDHVEKYKFQDPTGIEKNSPTGRDRDKMLGSHGPNNNGIQNLSRSDMIYYRRLIGSILEQMGVKNHIFGPGDILTIDLQGEISFESFMTLIDFLSIVPADEHLPTLHLVDTITSKLIHVVPTQGTTGTVEFLKEEILLLLSGFTTPKMWLVLFSIGVVVFITITICSQMLAVRNSPMRFLFYALLLFFVFSCVWIYAEQQFNARAENMARLEQFGGIPSHCQFHNFTMWESLGYYASVTLFKHADQCVEYYKQIGMDTFYKTSPVEAISEAAARFIFHPLDYIGKKLGGFVTSFLDSGSILAKPVMLLMLIVFLVLGYLAIFPFRIRTPLFTIEPMTYTKREALYPPPSVGILQHSQSGPVVRVLSREVGTDTDDLEEFISSQFSEQSTAPASINSNSGSSHHPLINFIRRSFEFFTSLLILIFRDSPVVDNQEFSNKDEDEIRRKLSPALNENVVNNVLNPIVQQNDTDQSNERETPHVIGMRNSNPHNGSQSRNGNVANFDEVLLAYDDDLLDGELEAPADSQDNR